MTIYLVRHAEAGPAPDELRPLTEAGRRRAEAIAAALATAGITRVLSSRYVRCEETIRPLAERIGLPLEHHPHLAEEADVEDAWTLLEHFADEGATPVVCSHGNVLSPLLDRVRRRGADIAGDWSLRKGAVWRLDADGTGHVTRATLLP